MKVEKEQKEPSALLSQLQASQTRDENAFPPFLSEVPFVHTTNEDEQSTM